MVVSSGDTVVVERVDVNDLGGTIVTFNVVAIFDLSDGLITCWREYWDTGHVGRQLGIDPRQMFEPLTS